MGIIYTRRGNHLGYVTGTNNTARSGKNCGEMECWGNGKPISKNATPDVWQKIQISLLYNNCFR